MLQFPRKPLLALSVTTALSLSSAAKANYFSENDRVSFNSAIVDAVEYKDKEGLENMLRLGINPNEAGDFGTTSLIRAAYHGDKQMVELLLMAGANPNVTDIGGATALHIAAREGHNKVVELLTIHGAEVNVADGEGNTPLMRASANGHEETTEILTIAGAKVNEINDHGESAILYAANSNSEEIVNTLLREGADTNIIDEGGNSLNQIAGYKGNEMMIASLSNVSDTHIDLIMEKKPAPYQMNSTQLAAIQPAAAPTVELEPAINSKEVLAKLEEENKINLAEATQTERPRKDWLNGLKEVFDAAGAFELASVRNYEEGTKYILLDLGSFKDRAFAERRVAKMKSEQGATFNELGLAIIEKGSEGNSKFHVNAGILNDKDSALKICKKLVSKGINCRPVETTLITAEQFGKFSVQASAPSRNISPAASAKVETKDLMDFEEVTSAKVPEAPAKPIYRVKPKAIAKVEAKPVPKIEPRPAQTDLFSFVDEDARKEVAKAEPEKKDERPKIAKAPKVIIKPKDAAVMIKPKEKIELVIDEQESDEPSLMEIAGMEKPTVAPRKIAVKASPIKAPVKTAMQKDQERLDRMIEKINRTEPIEAPQFEKIAIAARPEPVKTPNKVDARARALPPIVAAEKPNYDDRVSGLASFDDTEPTEVKPIAVASRTDELPRISVDARPAANYQKSASANAEPIADFIKREEPAPRVETEKFRVSEPIRVESTPVAPTFSSSEIKPVHRQRAPEIYSGPSEVRTFDRYHNMEEKWVQIDYFETDAVAKAYWSNVYIDAGMPDEMSMSAIQLFHTNEKYYSAFIGPFNNKMAAEGFCEEYSPDGTKCRISKRPINSSARDMLFPKPTGAGIKGRHSSGKKATRKRGGFLDSSNSNLRNDAREIYRDSAMLSGNWTLQFGTYPSAGAARDAWNSIQSRTAKLGRITSDIVKSPNKNKYRLRAGAFNSKADADYFCDKMKSRAVDCIIVKG